MNFVWPRVGRQGPSTVHRQSTAFVAQVATFEIQHLTFFHQDNELVWWEIIQGWFVSKLETVTEFTRSNWRARVWHTCVHGRVGRVRFWQLHGDRFSLVEKNDKKREGPTRMQPLHTATRALFCPERKQSGKPIKIYSCTRAQFTVRQMDHRLCDRLY